MVTVDEVKEYLNIFDDSNDKMLESMIQGGYDYLVDAIDDFDYIYAENEVFARKADSFVKHYFVPDAYDQREGMYDGARIDMNRPARAVLTQLQLYRKEES